MIGSSLNRELKPLRRSLIEPDTLRDTPYKRLGADPSLKQSYHTMTEEAVLEETKMKEPGASSTRGGKLSMARSLERSGGHHRSDLALFKG